MTSNKKGASASFFILLILTLFLPQIVIKKIPALFSKFLLFNTFVITFRVVLN